MFDLFFCNCTEVCPGYFKLFKNCVIRSTSVSHSSISKLQRYLFAYPLICPKLVCSKSTIQITLERIIRESLNQTLSNYYLLPEFSGGVNVLDLVRTIRNCFGLVEEERASVCIPVVVTRIPGQFRGQGRKHVVKGPAQDHIVVTVEEEDNDSGGPANT